MSDTDEPLGYSALLGCACFNVRNAARAVTSHYDRVLLPSGLRITQFAILSMVRVAGSITMQALAARLSVDPSTLSRTLQPLEKSGLLRIEEGTDRRVREAVLTAAGNRKLVETAELWRAAQAEIKDKLGAERFDRLLADLGDLAGVL